MKRSFVVAVACLLLLLGLAAYGGPKQEAESEAGPVVLKLAHVYNPGHIWDKGANLAAEQVAAKTNGQVKIEIFPASQLGTEEQITEGVVFGSIDVCVSGAGQIGNLFKPINVLEMPYVFKDLDHVLRFAESDIAKEMFADLEEEFNIKVIGTSSFGVRHVLSVGKPVVTPDDLKGFKLRVPQQQVTVAYGKAMGAEPTPIAYAEAYLALQQNVVDGLENPLSAIENMRFYEVGKYINLTGHVINTTFFIMNGPKFASLSKTQQTAVMEAFSQASTFIVDELKKADEDLVSFFQGKGLQIVQSDMSAFQQKTAEMPASFSKWWIRYGADLHKRIQGM